MMFEFLKKKSKKYSINFSEIGVDIHSHLIPGVDDGAKDLKDSIELIKGLKDLGFKKIITTPHIYSDYYPNTSNRLLAGLDTLRQGLKAANIDIEVSCAAEYFMDEIFEKHLNENDILTVYDNYVLVEMSFFSESIRLEEYLFKMQIKGYQPILAHPERYTYYAKNFERFQNLKDRGCKLQLNLLSLTGHYGKEVKDLAIQLLDANLYDFVGTDTHNVEHLEKLKTLIPTDKKAISLGNKFLNNTFLD
jgi:tyrosine-protein phosphatase YwqE